MRQQITAAECDLPREKPVLLFFSDYVDYIVRLQSLGVLAHVHRLKITLEHSDFALRIDMAKQQWVEDVLRANIFQRIRRHVGDLIVTGCELLSRRDAQLELIAVA